MTIRTALALTAAVYYTSCVTTHPLAAAERTRPNFVFILVDDLGWADLGCYGSTFYETPRLDQFAKSALRFTDAYASCPVCSPTRGSILTGKYPTTLGITDWIPGADPRNRSLLGPQDRHALPADEITLAEALKADGYSTFFAGKWHFGGDGSLPQDHGFDINKGGHHRGSPPGGYYAPYNNPQLSNGPKGEYLTDRLVDESIRFLEQNRKTPFLLYLSFYTVHTPIQACRRHVEHFQKKAQALSTKRRPDPIKEHDGLTNPRQDNPAYASMVHAMDENVGRLLDRLDQLDLSNHTVVIFTSDNGGLSTKAKPNCPTCNLPLRAGKGWCYEGGIRVPLIIRVPGTTKAHSNCSVPVSSIDLYPTMINLASIKNASQQRCEGVTLTGLLAGDEKLERDAIYWHYPHYHGSTWAPGAAVRAGDWKLIEFYDPPSSELYNLREDIGERNERSDKEPEKKQQLLNRLHKWQQATGARMPNVNPGFKPPRPVRPM